MPRCLESKIHFMIKVISLTNDAVSPHLILLYMNLHCYLVIIAYDFILNYLRHLHYELSLVEPLNLMKYYSGFYTFL